MWGVGPYTPSWWLCIQGTTAWRHHWLAICFLDWFGHIFATITDSIADLSWIMQKQPLRIWVYHVLPARVNVRHGWDNNWEHTQCSHSTVGQIIQRKTLKTAPKAQKTVCFENVAQERALPTFMAPKFFCRILLLRSSRWSSPFVLKSEHLSSCSLFPTLGQAGSDEIPDHWHCKWAAFQIYILQSQSKIIIIVTIIRTWWACLRTI